MTEGPRASATPDPRTPFILHLDGFEGPLDLLLDLARTQKVDLARISIVSLVDQYLAIIEGARRIRLELAADWLVMAAWLTWLKSRLLLPPSDDPADDPIEAADTLAARLETLAHIQRAARHLAACPQLGHEVFSRGTPERLVALDRSSLAADLPGLVRAYLAAARRGAARRGYDPKPLPLWTVADAVARLQRMLGPGPAWTALDRFLPDVTHDPMPDPQQRRAALASTLLAGLELARTGTVDLRQDAPFAPIYLRGLHGT